MTRWVRLKAGEIQTGMLYSEDHRIVQVLAFNTSTGYKISIILDDGDEVQFIEDDIVEVGIDSN